MTDSSAPSRVRYLLGFVKLPAMVLSGVAAALLFIVCVVGVSGMLFCLSSEPVVPYETGVPASEYDGKLVRLHVDEIRAEGQGAAAPLFGIEDKGVAVRCAFHTPAGTHGRVHYNRVHGVTEFVHIAPVLRCADFELKLNPAVLLSGDCLSRPIKPGEYTMPEALKSYVLQLNENDVLLQAESAPGPTVNMALYYMPSPWLGDFYLVGRVRGNVLDLTEPGCGFILGAEAAANKTHRFFPSRGVRRINPLWWCLILVSLFTISLVIFFVKPTRSFAVSLGLAAVFAVVLVGSTLFLAVAYWAQVGFLAYMAPCLPWAVGAAALLTGLGFVFLCKKAR